MPVEQLGYEKLGRCAVKERKKGRAQPFRQVKKARHALHMQGVSPLCYTSQLSCAEIVKHPPPHTHKIASTESPVFMLMRLMKSTCLLLYT